MHQELSYSLRAVSTWKNPQVHVSDKECHVSLLLPTTAEDGAALAQRPATPALALHGQARGSSIELEVLQHGGVERQWMTACGEVDIYILSSQCDKEAVLHWQCRISWP